MSCVTTVTVAPDKFSENFKDLTEGQKDEVEQLLMEKIRAVCPKRLTDSWQRCVFTGLVTRGLIFARLDELVVEKLTQPPNVAKMWSLADTPPSDWVPISPTEHEASKLLEEIPRGGGGRTEVRFEVEYDKGDGKDRYRSSAKFTYLFRRAGAVE